MAEPEAVATPRPGGFGRLLKGVVLILLLSLAGMALIWAHAMVKRPVSGAAEQVVLIPAGAGRVAILARLESRAIAVNSLVWRLEALRRGSDWVPKAGEYAIPPRSSIADIMDILDSGRSIQHSLTIPEGITSLGLVRLLEAEDRLSGTVQLMAEGSVLPETYFFTRNTDRQLLVARMQQAREVAFAAAWSARQQGLPLASLAEAVVLASMVERETGLDGERGLVAGVFINRLRLGMRLQSDPTVIYGLDRDGVLDRPLSRADWKVEHRWNTYRISGLPPTPIAHPGLASLEAVLHPEETEALYFVADGKGGHRFARTLEEHNANIRRWRAQRGGSP